MHYVVTLIVQWQIMKAGQSWQVYIFHSTSKDSLVNLKAFNLSFFFLSRYDKAAFCLEELILSNPHNYIFHQRYAEVNTLHILPIILLFFLPFHSCTGMLYTKYNRES